MPAVIGSIAVEIVDDSARFTQSMNRNAALVAQQSQRMSAALGGVASSVDSLNRKASGFQPDAFRSLSLSALRAQNSVDRLQKSILAVTALAGGGFGTALLVKNLTDTADRFSNIQNRLATVVGTGKERLGVEQEIFEISNRTRSSYDDTAKLFQRMSLASKTLGASEAQVLQVVETTQKALQAGGATGSEAASIATQLTQAFGSGNVAGDELRAIRENSTILAQAIADEFKVGVGELKKLGATDQLPADRVFKAILRAGKAIDDQFASMTPTIAQAVVVLDNAFTRYIGQVDQSLGVTNAMAQGIIALANNLQTLGAAAAYAAVPLAAVFANRVAQRGLGAIAAPFQAEKAARAEAVTKAKEGVATTAEDLAKANKRVLDVQAQAQVDPASFAEAKILRAREDLKRQLTAQEAQLLTQERKYQAALAAATASGAGPGAAPVARAERARDRTAERIQQTRGTLGLIEASAGATGGAAAAKALAAAEGDVATASGKADAAQKGLAQRIRETERGATLAAAATRTFAGAGMSLYNFLGGGWGVALTAAAVGFGIYEVAQARAEARTKEFNDEAEKSIKIIERLQEGYTHAAAAAANASFATIQRLLPEQVQNLRTTIVAAAGTAAGGESILDADAMFAVPLANAVAKTQPALKPLLDRFDEMRKEGNLTKEGIADLVRSLEELSSARPDLSGAIDEILKLANALGTAIGQSDKLKGAVGESQRFDPTLGQVLTAQFRGGELGDDPKTVEKINEEARQRLIEGMKTQAQERNKTNDAVLEAQLTIATRNENRDEERRLRRMQINAANPGATEAQRDILLEAAMSKVKTPKKAKETPEERLSERIARIREEAESSFLPEIDQEVIREITKTKGTSKIAGDVRRQLAAGQPLTGEFADLRSAEIAKDAAKEYKNIVETYGDMNQVTPFVRNEQEKLNFLLASGKINAAQAGSALADYMGKFKEFQWIDKLTDSLKSFGETLADTLYDGKLNADTFADAINNLGKALFKLALNEAALEPLRQMLRTGLAKAFAPGGGGLAGLFGGGGGGGADTSGDFAGVTAAEMIHTGGLVGHIATMRAVPSALFRDAPHYKSGLRPDEFAAVLHRGEAVLTARQQMGMAAMAGGMANMKGGYNVVVNEAPGTQAQVSQGENGGLQIDILSLAEAGLADRMARGRGPLAKASRAGGRSNLRG